MEDNQPTSANEEQEVLHEDPSTNAALKMLKRMNTELSLNAEDANAQQRSSPVQLEGEDNTRVQILTERVEELTRELEKEKQKREAVEGEVMQ